MKQIGRPNQGSQQIGQMLLAMTEVMVEMIAVIFEDLDVFVLDLPAGMACGDYLHHVIVGNRLRRCPGVAENHLAFGIDCGHGLVSTRQANLHDMQLSDIDNRWQHSGLRTLVVMNRQTFAKSSQQTTNETAYYLSNYQNDDQQHTVKSLASVIRGHWSVESNKWQLDVTFGEDRVQVKNGSQAQIMGKLRCFAMNLLRWTKTETQNFQASIEKFTDSPRIFDFHA